MPMLLLACPACLPACDQPREPTRPSLLFLACFTFSGRILTSRPPPHLYLTEREQTVSASKMSAMKKNAKANTQKDFKHLRKGGAGGWRDVFKVRESEAFDRVYREQMEGSGLEMDFGEGLSM